jgi:hypothetical protein
MEQIKQTAVEWLIKIYLQTNKIDNFDIEQAKEIEKVQISQAYTTGVEEDVYSNPLRTGEMYYNETYGGNK